jgi:hypothetical protein
MEAEGFSETMVIIGQTTWCHYQENHNLNRESNKKMEAVYSSKMSVNLYCTPQHHIPGDSNHLVVHLNETRW